MTRLSQIIGIELGVRSDSDATLARLTAMLSNAGRLAGLRRTYQPKDAENGHEYQGEATKVQVTVEDVLAQLVKSQRRLLDVALTKETANANATADLVADGHVIARQLPATYFLGLGRTLTKLREFVEGLPTLDTAEDWAKEGAPPGQWRSVPVRTDKTRKQPRNHVKWEPPDATYTQPAQIETFAEDIPEGWWTLVKFNGSIPEQVKASYLERIAQLQEAVTIAQHEANAMEIEDESVGTDILGFIFQ